MMVEIFFLLGKPESLGGDNMKLSSKPKHCSKTRGGRKKKATIHDMMTWIQGMDHDVLSKRVRRRDPWTQLMVEVEPWEKVCVLPVHGQGSK